MGWYVIEEVQTRGGIPIELGPEDQVLRTRISAGHQHPDTYYLTILRHTWLDEEPETTDVTGRIDT